MNIKNEFVVPAVIVGAALIIAVMVGSFAFLRSRGFDNTLSVTGSATESVMADTASWSFSLSRQATEGSMQTAYNGMASDLAAARKFLSDNGVPESAVTVTPVFADEMYKYGEERGPREFNVRQSVTVKMADPAAMDRLSKATGALTARGVIIMPSQPQYSYSKLADLRVSLLGEALADARARASEIAGSAGTKVGPLKAASSGVVQVMAPGSVEVSDYGQYDTSTIEKTVMVTVRATFFVR